MLDIREGRRMARHENGTKIRARGVEVPYSSRLLTESLISLGFVSRMAQEIAEKVAAELERTDAISITKNQLREIVHRVVSRDYGKKHAKRFPIGRDADFDVWVEGVAGSFPYSKGIMAQSLMASGLPPNIAYDAARSIEIKLKDDQMRSISRESLRSMTYNILKTGSSQEHADKYLLWRKLKATEKPLIIMIGGATGVGKSTIAAEVAHRLGITRIICTDIIRSVMRGMISPDLLPAIHSSSYGVAETLTVPLPENSEPILIGFTEQVSKIVVGINAVINRAAAEKVSTLIEGVHVVPKFIAEHQKKVYEIIVVIKVSNYKAHRARFYQRYEENPNRETEKYLSRFEAIRDIQDYVAGLARKHNIPVINNMNLDQAVESTMEEITKQVQKLGIKLGMEHGTFSSNA